MSTEQMIPLHAFDAMPMFANMVLTVMLKYDRVLDPHVLKDSMIELIDREGWRKLGSRLQRDAKGNLVYHVPAAFNESCPAITFSHVHHDTTMAEHPLAQQMPSPESSSPKDRPAIMLDPENLSPLARRADAPHSLREFIARALPQLELHVVTFRDGTTVGVSCLHSLLDGMGLGAGGLLGAWSLVLRGKSHEVPPVCGVDRDPLCGLAKLHRPSADGKPAPEYKQARFLMGPLGTLVWTIRRAWEMLRYREEARIVRVPGRFLTGLREALLEQLAASTADSDDGQLLKEAERPWVSEGDVLVAWWSRYATLHLAGQPSRPVTVTNAYNMRKALAGTLLPPRDSGHVYLSNCATGLHVHTTVGALGATAETAAKVRRCILEMGTLEQLAAMQATCMPDPRRLWKMRMCGAHNTHMNIFTNWSQALFYQIDLGAAVVAKGWNEGNEKVLPSFVNYHLDSRIWPMRDGFIIVGKDGEGDYWLAGALRKGLWAKIEEELEKEKL